MSTVKYVYAELSRSQIYRLLSEENRHGQFVVTKCVHHPNFKYEGTTADGHEAFIEHSKVCHECAEQQAQAQQKVKHG